MVERAFYSGIYIKKFYLYFVKLKQNFLLKFGVQRGEPIFQVWCGKKEGRLNVLNVKNFRGNQILTLSVFCVPKVLLRTIFAYAYLDFVVNKVM